MQTQQTFLSKYKSLIILALDFVFMLVLIKILPFFCSRESRASLADFYWYFMVNGSLLNITVTSLMVPVVAIGLGLINTQKALAPFSTPIIYMFFGGFVVAAVLQIQNLDKNYCELHYPFSQRKLKTFYYLPFHRNDIPFHVD